MVPLPVFLLLHSVAVGYDSQAREVRVVHLHLTMEEVIWAPGSFLLSLLLEKVSVWLQYMRSHRVSRTNELCTKGKQNKCVCGGGVPE